ncbi:MAG: amidase [Deltaproteobacteria bacterium]|nr:amidase [Deltaproteobacteria bacterium]
MPDFERLAEWDAVETAARVRSGAVTAREVIEAAILRAEAAASLGAVVAPTYERARARADGAEGAALFGVPTFVKDLAQVQGVQTSWGSRGAGDYVSRKTDPFVRSLEETGLLMLGKSATPELGLTATTEPLDRAPCRNPWAPSRSSGGSSGGAASLVAAGVVPLAHGSDGGGSIRIPAACCGLVGLKPSRFRLDMEGSNLLPVNIATDGVLTQTVRDTIAFYETLESKRPRRRVEPIGPVASEPRAGLRVAVFADAPLGTPVDAEHQGAARGLGRLLESCGHRVEEITCPFEAQVIEDFLTYWGLVAWVQLTSARVMLHWGFDRSRFEPWSTGLARSFSSNRLATLAAVGRLRRFGRRYAEVMATYDLLVCPTVAHPPPPLGHFSADLAFETVFDRLRNFVPFTPIQNIAGAPAISLPWGQSRSGAPIGVQLAAAPGADRLLLEVAQVIEAAQPWPRIAPRARWAEEASNPALAPAAKAAL